MSNVHTISSKEKRHERALVMRRHDKLQRQCQVSIRIKEQKKCLMYEKCRPEL